MTEPDDDLRQLAALDFAVNCALTHYGVPCTRPADLLVTLHYCYGSPKRVPLCGTGMEQLRQLDYPNYCSHCGAPFQTVHEFVWNIEPL